MTVGDLRKLLEGVGDEVRVLLPVDMGEFDGHFLSPCIEESGISEMGINEDSIETEPAFVIVPCGFFQEHEGVPAYLN